MTSEKAKQLVMDILRRTNDGALRWSPAPGNTLVAAVAGKLRLSYDLDGDWLSVSGVGSETHDLVISSYVEVEGRDRSLDTDLVVPELRMLREAIERTFQRNVEQRVDEFLSILSKT